jgi:hypothetical protein
MTENVAPFEIIAGPVTLYHAPVGSLFPILGEDPLEMSESPWVLIGTNGALNYKDDGVTVRHSQTTHIFRSLGETGPRKVFRSAEDLLISVILADLSLEQYRHALNLNAVAEVGTIKTIGLSRGPVVALRALLIRGTSPYANARAQYEVPRAFQTGEPEVVFRKDEPAGLMLQWTAVVDEEASTPEERFGRLRAETEEPVAP